MRGFFWCCETSCVSYSYHTMMWVQSPDPNRRIGWLEAAWRKRILSALIRLKGKFPLIWQGLIFYVLSLRSPTKLESMASPWLSADKNIELVIHLLKGISGTNQRQRKIIGFVKSSYARPKLGGRNKSWSWQLIIAPNSFNFRLNLQKACWLSWIDGVRFERQKSIRTGLHTAWKIFRVPRNQKALFLCFTHRSPVNQLGKLTNDSVWCRNMSAAIALLFSEHFSWNHKHLPSLKWIQWSFLPEFYRDFSLQNIIRTSLPFYSASKHRDTGVGQRVFLIRTLNPHAVFRGVRTLTQSLIAIDYDRLTASWKPG